MKRVALVSALVWVSVTCAAETALFNGRDLSGWTSVADHDVTGGYSAAEPTWFVTNGALRTTGTPFGYLRTKRDDFRDFTLTLEYRWWRETAKPNSGVFLRLTRETGTFIPTCYENQLCRGEACNLFGLAGKPLAGHAPRTPYNPSEPLSGIAAAVKAEPDAERAFGEWNTLELTLRGDTLTGTLNGRIQNRVTGLDTAPGAIALQSEGGAVEFRNIRLAP